MPADAKIKPLKRVIHPIEIDTTALDVVVLDENSAASNAAKVQAEAHWRWFGTPEFYAFDNGPDFCAIRWN
ncbi:hypothetical protein [Ferrovibrio xuzhouensis]|uniref:Transposase n=1 Tax=Ferrovibrio xuzhouensis TaxID=1576914 RepID=A0ABV7VMG5_9PROT